MKDTQVVYALKTKKGQYFTANVNNVLSSDRNEAFVHEDVGAVLSQLQSMMYKVRSRAGLPAANISKSFQVVRIETEDRGEVRRLLSDCEGCNEGETIQFAIQHMKMDSGRQAFAGDGVKIWPEGLTFALLFPTALLAAKHFGTDRFWQDYTKIVRVAVSPAAPVVTETVLS